ncbi:MULTISPECIES: hypothetical protein [Bacillus]|uniref:hypothetical protein n=1 Tax=Bacillus TaxID=1386 RepID=UPI001428B6BD|nr:MULTISPECIES: hypothetical protein [Bacillus]MBU8727818.1 hypothetical protein [Bacillus pumilus]MCP1149469.1 hypothetical protein [Bacillus sp. 1735sda2]
MTIEKVIELAAFFAEFEQKMIRKKRTKVANFSKKQMIKWCHVYLKMKGAQS